MQFGDFVYLNPRTSLNRGQQYSHIDMADIEPGRRYIKANHSKQFSGSGTKFLSGDTLFARITPCLENGKIAQFIGAEDLAGFGSTEFFVFRAIPGISDPGFVYYIASTPVIRGPAEKSMAGASGRQRASAQAVAEIEVQPPTLSDQRRIASVLSAYDDLIENNTRRIAILEEMARRLYQEWFVHFRFPGHEKVKLIDSELGPIPKGWEVAALGEAASFVSRGISPKYDDDASCRVINQRCIRDQRLSLEPVRRQSKRVPPEKYVLQGDVLINSTGVGTLGRVAQVCCPLDETTVDSHVTIVRPSGECDHHFFGLTLMEMQPHFEAQGVGSTGQTELSRTRVAETMLLVPPVALQESFGQLVSPIRDLCLVLDAKNANLRTQRDLLLPKLISGEIDVSDMTNIAIKDAA